ncbi:thermonuclease family protein, partial [Falsiroseomonas oryziterrae]|uniref:thermonuclease family protein n=1 Tax=Falsiroseomonas oryziterrae TaxID=2911368 RepID=UPI001F401C2E
AFWEEAMPDAYVSGAARVVDGDTLVLAGTTIRLHGVDAPEARQRCERGGAPWDCGAAATAELQRLTEGQVVRCATLGQDRFDRLLGRCEAGEEDLAAALVRQGLAVAYTRYSWRYLPQELRARWDGAGLWSGRFETPEEWRRQQAR